MTADDARNDRRIQPDPASVVRATLGPEKRLRTKTDFQEVFARRNSAAGRCLIVYGRPNELGYSRFGVSIGRRYGSAPQRNRFKRVCREAYRLNGPRLPVGWDFVVIPRTSPKGSGEPCVPERPMLDRFAHDLINAANSVARRGRRAEQSGRSKPSRGDR